MMYSNIVKELVFQYIEHGIIRYDFVYDIDMYLFQVLPLLHWTYEFSKIMIIMYFCHHFPLNSHIRGHLLSSQMALLRPSADILHVGTQKDKLGLKWSKYYRWAWPRMHYPQNIFVYIFYKCWFAYVTICIANCVPYMIICIATHVHLCTRVSFEQLACHMRVSYINSRAHLVSTLKNIKQY